MKTIISFAISLLFFIDGSKGQDIQVSLMPSFVENQVKNYSITYSVRSSGNGTEQIMSTTKKQVKIKVVAIHDDFIDMQWQYGKVEFTEANSQINPFAVLMNTLSAGITVKYSIDKKGVINSITNRDEITATIQKNVDEKLTSMANDGSISSSMITTTKFQIQMMLSTLDQVDKIVLGDLFKFHQLYGKEYSSQPTEITVNQELLPEKYEVSLYSIDQANHSCLIKSRLIDDSNKEIIKEYRYNLTDYWLINHASQRASSDPLDVIQLYQIQLLP